VVLLKPVRFAATRAPDSARTPVAVTLAFETPPRSQWRRRLRV
jgi:hypothetical protein